MRINSARILAAIFLLITSSAAFAHPGHVVSGLAAGLMHPFSGFDHLLVMFAVGFWAAQNNKCNGGCARKVWLLPAAFMIMLAVGAGISMLWQSLPMVESGLAVSVLALGLLVALSMWLPVLFSVAITALFGLLHGYAHGLELPGSAAPAAYAFGFLAATASLHIIGIAAVVATRKHYGLLSRLAGSAIALSGAYLLASA
jgi:urease accessory protein